MRYLARLRKRFIPRSDEAWVDVGMLEEFPVETVRAIEVRGIPIAVFHTADGFRAIGDVCPHMGASLSDGALHDGEIVECPSHSLCFSLKTGQCVENEPYRARVFPLRVQRARLWIRA